MPAKKKASNRRRSSRAQRTARVAGTVAAVAGAVSTIADALTHPMAAPAVGMRRTARGYTPRIPMAQKFAHRTP